MAFLATFYWRLVAILTIHICPAVGHLKRNSQLSSNAPPIPPPPPPTHTHTSAQFKCPVRWDLDLRFSRKDLTLSQQVNIICSVVFRGIQDLLEKKALKATEARRWDVYEEFELAFPLPIITLYISNRLLATSIKEEKDNFRKVKVAGTLPT